MHKQTDHSPEHYINIIKEVYFDETSEVLAKYLDLFHLLLEAIEIVTKKNKHYFSTENAKINFIINEYAISDDIANDLRSLWNFAQKLRRNPKRKIDQNAINLAAKSAIVIINTIFDNPYNDEITEKILAISTTRIPFQREAIDKSETINILDAILIGAYQDEESGEYFLSLVQEDIGFDIRIDKEWSYLVDNIELIKHQELNLININDTDEGYSTNRKSFIVLSPYFLLDATELAECFSHSGVQTELFHLKQLSPSVSSISMLKGNIVNNIFDGLIIDPNQSAAELFDKAIKSSPLQLFAQTILHRSTGEIDKMKSEVLGTFYDNISIFAREIPNRDNAIIEPSYISHKWGIQGRLDLLVESEDDIHYKEIVELKSGSAPSKSKSKATDFKSRSMAAGMWINHWAQVSCYDLLLEAVYENRRGNSYIYYAKTTEDASRFATSDDEMRKHIVNTRNFIILQNLDFLNNNIESLIFSAYRNIEQYPSFTKKDINKLYSTYISAQDYVRQYYLAFVRFVLNEIQTQIEKESRTLCNSYNEYQSPVHKSIISELVINEEKSDFTQLHLHFDRPIADEFAVDTFRIGDSVSLYNTSNYTGGSINNMVLKCGIKDISPNHIVVTLRNKLFPRRKLTVPGDKWAVASEASSRNNKKLLGALTTFLFANKQKQDILMGVSEPRLLEEPISVHYEGLTDNQNKILNEILNSRDYYLLQGPPGTGKTSYLLRHLVKYLHEESDEVIILLAYTNRAVDEICEVLNKLGYEYLRLGNRDSSKHQDRLIVNMIENGDIRKLFHPIRQMRIIAATVTTALNSPEIYDIWRFTTAIVDEASQVLEPHIIGTLSRMNRFILIGDEKQLPAISTQDANNIENFQDDELLGNLGFTSLGNSIFERLLRNAHLRGWNHCNGMLKKQARMHKEVQDFPNYYFYSSELEPLDIDNRQTQEFRFIDLSNNADVPQYIEELASNRFVFLDVPKTRERKSNRREASIITEIISHYVTALGDDFHEKSIGVISPFRAQCAQIRNMLNDTLHPEIANAISIDTVERFQGSECDIILYSFATNSEFMLNNVSSINEIGGELVDRKLNVALTRAREQVVILGNSPLLSKNHLFSELINYSKEKGKYIIL